MHTEFPEDPDAEYFKMERHIIEHLNLDPEYYAGVRNFPRIFSYFNIGNERNFLDNIGTCQPFGGIYIEAIFLIQFGGYSILHNRGP